MIMCSCGRMPCDAGMDLCWACEEDYHWERYHQQIVEEMLEEEERESRNQ